MRATFRAFASFLAKVDEKAKCFIATIGGLLVGGKYTG